MATKMKERNIEKIVKAVSKDNESKNHETNFRRKCNPAPHTGIQQKPTGHSLPAPHTARLRTPHSPQLDRQEHGTTKRTRPHGIFRESHPAHSGASRAHLPFLGGALIRADYPHGFPSLREGADFLVKPHSSGSKYISVTPRPFQIFSSLAGIRQREPKSTPLTQP